MEQEHDKATETSPEAARPDTEPAPQATSRKGLGIPSWTLAILILTLTGVLVWAGDALIRSRQRTPTPTQALATNQPTSTAALVGSTPSPTTALSTRASTATTIPLPPTSEAAEQTVVLATGFETREGGNTAVEDAAEGLYAALLARAEQLPVERFSLVVSEPSTDPANQQEQADYLLWGYGDAQGLTAYIRRITPTLPVTLSPQARKVALSTPVETELCTLDADLDVDPVIDYVLGITVYQRDELEQASFLFNRALSGGQERETKCRPQLAHTHLYLGNLAALADDYETALAEYLAGMELASGAKDRALFYTNQASIHYLQEDYQAALSAANLALEQDETLANAYYHRANTYRALDRIENARKDLDRALALDPTHASAYASRGLIHHNANALQEALGDYDRSLTLDPWAADVYLNRGGTYATLGDMDAALQDYGRALELAPDDADAYYNRGTVYAIQQRYPEALQDLARALEIRPDFAQVYGNRGLVYKAMGDIESAIADLERYIELSGNSEWREMIEQQLAELKQTQQ